MNVELGKNLQTEIAKNLWTEIDALHSSEYDGHSSKWGKKEGASDTSQVRDDLFLLRLVLSKKASSILAGERQQDDMAIFNLEAILANDGKGQRLVKKMRRQYRWA